MPLSTFNSSIPMPFLPYKKMWILAVAAALGLLLSMEFYWRTHNYLPSVTDDFALWAYHRGDVYSRGGYKKIVIIGSSRGQLDIDPKILCKELTGYRAVQLCIDGSYPIETLEHLADDVCFDGIVLCDLIERCLGLKEGYTGQKAWCDYYDLYWTNWGRIDKGINSRIKAFLQERFVVCNSNLLLIWQISGWRYLKPFYMHLRADRYRPASYYRRMTSKELEDHKNRRVRTTRENYAEDKKKNLGSIERFNDKLTTRIRAAVEKIQKRNGDVIFIKMPVSGEVASIENSAYPREKFWDSISRLTGAKTIHYGDYAGLNNFVCPDGSHLDYNDAKVFSEELGRVTAGLLNGK